MNHRELILTACKKAKFGFLKLPEELQDDIIDGLDGQTLTLEAARDLVKARGYSISHVAIAKYYRAVRTERRLQDANQELSRIIEEFGKKSYEEGLDSLVNLVVALAATGLADGTVGIKDIDLGKLLAALNKGRQGVKAEAQNAGDSDKTEGCWATVREKPKGLSLDAANEIRRSILGIK
jgi:hypothetical protein